MRVYRITGFLFVFLLLLGEAVAQEEKYWSTEAGYITNIISQDFSDYKVQSYSPRPGAYAGGGYTFPFLRNQLFMGGFIEYVRLKDLSEDILTNQNGDFLAADKSILRQYDFSIMSLYKVSFGIVEVGTGLKSNLMLFGSSKSVYPGLILTASPNYLK